jgi:DNA topoisomerase VI subunit A
MEATARWVPQSYGNTSYAHVPSQGILIPTGEDIDSFAMECDVAWVLVVEKDVRNNDIPIQVYT